jgi:hypothetical protein
MLKHGFLLLLVGLTIPAWARNWNAKGDWRATGDGKTDDSPAIQRGVAAMRSGDTVVFPAPGTYFVASTVHFSAPGIRVKCEPGPALVGSNSGTDLFANLQSNTAIGGSSNAAGKTYLEHYQNIEACEGQQFQAENILIHHNFSDSHHHMFMEINNGNGYGKPTDNAGIDGFQVYDNYDVNAGGPYPEANTFGLSAPFAQVKQPGSNVYTSTPMSGVIWYNNLLKGLINNNEYVGIGTEVGACDMNIYNNTAG